MAACSVRGCTALGEWRHGRYWRCEEHSLEALRVPSDDREDFADECAREDQRERERADQEGP